MMQGQTRAAILKGSNDPIDNLTFEQAVSLLKEIREKVAKPLLSCEHIDAAGGDTTIYDIQDTLSLSFGIDWAWDDKAYRST